jgi:Mce-associated membrane protein
MANTEQSEAVERSEHHSAESDTKIEVVSDDEAERETHLATVESGVETRHAASDDELVLDASSRQKSSMRGAMAIGLIVVIAIAGMSSWQGYRFYQTYRGEQQRALFVAVARQGAVDLTTVDWQHADENIKRIENSAIGTFHDDFVRRSGPFAELLKQVQSNSVGTIDEAALESVASADADVLVAIQVKTTTPAAPQGEIRSWRMRISVQRISDHDAKIANVAFVP